MPPEPETKLTTVAAEVTKCWLNLQKEIDAHQERMKSLLNNLNGAQAKLAAFADLTS